MRRRVHAYRAISGNDAYGALDVKPAHEEINIGEDAVERIAAAGPKRDALEEDRLDATPVEPAYPYVPASKANRSQVRAGTLNRGKILPCVQVTLSETAHVSGTGLRHAAVCPS